MATTKLPFGVVNAPGQRYHPAIVAQAAATLEVMFPGRFWVAFGSGSSSTSTSPASGGWRSTSGTTACASAWR
jgi:alkanesulfonate monooxygenase SsuD/methylene tetrahydromethanopterin reductase-like flavin-dependent oxidoreductase (luciferase family)